MQPPSLLTTRARTDLPERLATVVSAWGTLSLFFPFFSELHLDWRAQLAPALREAAAAHTLPTIRHALLALLAPLHDNHIRVTHADLLFDGALPIALRRFADHVFVVGGLADYARAAPLGAELLAIDHVPALQAYDTLDRLTSSATSGWTESYVPYLMTLGPIGSFATVRLRTLDG